MKLTNYIINKTLDAINSNASHTKDLKCRLEGGIAITIGNIREATGHEAVIQSIGMACRITLYNEILREFAKQYNITTNRSAAGPRSLAKLEHALSKAMGVVHALPTNDLPMPNPCSGIYLTGSDTWQELFVYKTKPNFDKEEKMSFELTYPVLVGKIDILNASEGQLTELVRAAKAQIKADEDMSDISLSFKKKKEDLEKVIELCLAQLDKDLQSK